MLIDKPFEVIYIADTRYLDELCHELGDIAYCVDQLVFSTVKKTDVCFANDIWYEPKVVTIASIGDAVKQLRAAGKYWYLHPISHVRRSRLIESELRRLPSLAHTFPVTELLPPIGCFSLLDQNTMVYSTKRWKNAPMGEFNFVEDKTNPPNRAYLKLWEALSVWGELPAPGALAVDLGASPGGWTYVMQSLGAHVVAVDKAPLDPVIAALPNVSFLQKSAFALTPDDFSETIDWLLCDVACYPERTERLINDWITSKKAKRLIFTIKLQGETDFACLESLQAIPQGRVIHLLQNKHEATFFYPAPPELYAAF